MKLKITNILLLSLALLFPLISAAHPLKLSASLIEYDPKDKTIRLECKVFLDDFDLEGSLTFTRQLNRYFYGLKVNNFNMGLSATWRPR